MTGDQWTINRLYPGMNETFTSEPYTVTETDILAGSVKNEVTANGTNLSEEPTNPGDGDT